MKDETSGKFIPYLIGLLALILIFNQIQISSVSGMNTAESSSNVKLSAVNVIPTGIPKIYGQELGVSYDDVSVRNQRKADETISKLGNLDVKIELSSQELQRYINIASKISCEYCCGAQSIIFSNGQAACGCAHSYAMRGVAKYMIKYHSSEFTDDQILEELGKWKTLFFPGNIQKKAQILNDKGIELNYINLASNKYRGIEQGAASGGAMVGGC